MNRIDQQRLISLRMGRGLAVRQLARDCGIEIAVLNRLETAADPTLTTLSVAALVRLADHLGVPVGTLFTGDASSEVDSHEASDDTRALGSLLNALGQDTPVVALADALGWTSDRVHQAAASLDLSLRPAGMTVFKNSGLMSIRPEGDSHGNAALAVCRHPRARGKQRLVSPARAKVIYRAAQTPISPHSLSKSDRLQIATLLKAGVLIEDASRCLVPAEDVLLSLHPERH